MGGLVTVVAGYKKRGFLGDLRAVFVFVGTVIPPRGYAAFVRGFVVCVRGGVTRTGGATSTRAGLTVVVFIAVIITL